MRSYIWIKATELCSLNSQRLVREIAFCNIAWDAIEFLEGSMTSYKSFKSKEGSGDTVLAYGS